MDSAGEAWVEPFTLEGLWPALLTGAGGYVWPALAVLLGLTAAGLIIYVYTADAVPKPFCGIDLPTFPGVQEEYYFWGGFAAAVLLTAVMLLNCVLSFSSGFGGNAFNWAASEAGEILDGVQLSITDVNGVSQTAQQVTQDLSELYKICPPSIEQMLGSSVSRVKEDITKASSEASLAVKALEDFPALVQHGIDGLRGLSMWLPIFAGLNLGAVLVCAGAVWLQFLSSQNATVNKRLTTKVSASALGLVLPTCIAFATLVLCAAAAAELSTASDVARFCRDSGPDAKILRIAKQSAGESSSSYSVAEHYLTGSVPNPAMEHLELAQSSVVAGVRWLEEYKTVLQQTCPKWKADLVFNDLKNLEQKLNATEAVLEPAAIYTHYKQSTHVAACSGGTSGLAALAMEQIFLGAFLLPLLCLTTSWTVDFLTKGGAYQQLAQGKIDGQSSDDESKHEDLNSLYYVVYAFSVVIFGVGLWMYLVPQPGIVRPAVGTLLFATGVFLLMNSDLIVTYFRLHEQVEKFKSNNESYQKNLDKAAQEVRTLQTAAKGFEEIDRKFGSDIERAMKEMRTMQTTARSQMGMSIGRMVQLYLDTDGDKRISEKELEEATNTMADIFGAMIKGLRKDRLPKMLEAIRGHKSFRTSGSLSLDAFSKAFEITLFVPDNKQIIQSVRGAIDDAESRAAARAARRGRSP